MTNIDKSVNFVSINIALLTISDSRSENEDESGDLLNERITNFGHTVKKRLVITIKVLTSLVILILILNYLMVLH